MTEKYTSPEHAIRNIMSKENSDKLISEQAAPKIAPPASPPTIPPEIKPYDANVAKGEPPPKPANLDKPTIPKRDFLKDIGSFINLLKKFTPLGVTLKTLTPTEAGKGSEYRSDNVWTKDATSGSSAFATTPFYTPLGDPASPSKIAPKIEPASPPAPFKAPVYKPASPPAPFKAPVYDPASPVTPNISTDPSIGLFPAPIIAPKSKPSEKGNRPPKKGTGFILPLGASGVSTPGQSSISGFETPDYLHMAKTRLADKPAKIVKENTADDERRSIENVPRPKSDRNKSMTRNQEIKNKIIDENIKKKLIIKNAVKNGKDKNYSVEINPEYKQEKLSD